MAQATITAEALSLGPGRLMYAPLGTALPTDHTTPLDPAFAEIGSTKEGSSFSYEITRDPVEVAESLDPLFHVTTGREGTLSLEMAENTVRNLTIAYNGGTVESYGSGETAGFSYTPPEPGQEVGVTLVFDSQDGEERWLFRQVSQSGSVEMSRSKGADYATIPVEFSVERPALGGAVWTAFYGEVRSGGVEASAPAA